MYRDKTRPSLRRAIERSRAARAVQQRRRRRLALLTALFAVCLMGGGLWTIGAVTGDDMVEAAVTKAQSIADLIGQRSPGARTEGQLTKTKHARALAKQRTAPKQRIAAVIPTPKTTELAQLLEAPPIVPAVVDLEKPLPLAELMAPPPAMGGTIVPGPGGPPGESPPVSFPSPEPKTPVIPPSALPEPGTWATMLLGFSLIGWQVRRGKKGSPSAARRLTFAMRGNKIRQAPV